MQLYLDAEAWLVDQAESGRVDVDSSPHGNSDGEDDPREEGQEEMEVSPLPPAPDGQQAGRGAPRRTPPGAPCPPVPHRHRRPFGRQQAHPVTAHTQD